MQFFLQASGYHVTTAESVEGALQKAAQEEFDLLVSDIGLPDGNGEALIRKLRAKGAQPTEHRAQRVGTQEDIERSRAVGFQGHLIKPVSPQQLQTAIDQLYKQTAQRS